VGVARNYLLPRFGPKPLDAITRADVQTMLTEELAERRLSNSAIRRHVMMMAQILDAAVQDGRLGRNVARSIRLPPERSRRMRRLNEHELKRLIAATPSFYRPMIVTAAYTGLRWGELTGLGVEHIDFDVGTVRVERQLQDINGKMQFTQPKTKSGNRAVSVPPSLMAMLGEHVQRAQVKKSGLVFPDENRRPLRNSSFRRVWLRIVAKADLEGFVFHELRHTAAALAIAQGAHPTAIKERLGHASIVTTLDRYGGLFPSLDRDIAKGMNASVHRTTGAPASPDTQTPPEPEVDFGV
jgi:integrase